MISQPGPPGPPGPPGHPGSPGSMVSTSITANIPYLTRLPCMWQAIDSVSVWIFQGLHGMPGPKVSLAQTGQTVTVPWKCWRWVLSVSVFYCRVNPDMEWRERKETAVLLGPRLVILRSYCCSDAYGCEQWRRCSVPAGITRPPGSTWLSWVSRPARIEGRKGSHFNRYVFVTVDSRMIKTHLISSLLTCFFVLILSGTTRRAWTRCKFWTKWDGVWLNEIMNSMNLLTASKLVRYLYLCSGFSGCEGR